MIYGTGRVLSLRVLTDMWNKWQTTVYCSGRNKRLKLIHELKNLWCMFYLLCLIFVLMKWGFLVDWNPREATFNMVNWLSLKHSPLTKKNHACYHDAKISRFKPLTIRSAKKKKKKGVMHCKQIVSSFPQELPTSPEALGRGLTHQATSKGTSAPQKDSLHCWWRTTPLEFTPQRPLQSHNASQASTWRTNSAPSIQGIQA